MAGSDLAPVRRSPLSHREPTTGRDGLTMSEASHLGKLVLRANPSVSSKLKRTLGGAELPKDACRVTHSKDGHISVLWLGPDEWMIVCEAGKELALSTAMTKALKAAHHQIANVTDYYTCIDVSSGDVRELIMGLTTLDLHPRVFTAGEVKGSVFGHANGYLWQLITDTGQAESFRLIVRASMADYLWCLITRTGRIFGMPEELPISGETLVI